MESNLRRSFYLKTVSAEKLKIPPLFTEIYGEELLDTISITVLNGPVWYLGLEKTNTDIWLSKGWREFVEFYSIGRGNQLLFTYKDVSCFDVKIYDATGFEIEYPCTEDTKDDTSVEVLGEEEKDDNSVEILDEEDDSLKTLSEDEDSLETWSEEYDTSVEILESCDEITVSSRSGRPSHRDTLASKGELPKSSHVVMAGNKRRMIDHRRDGKPMTDEPECGGGKVYHSSRFKASVARASQGTRRAVNAAQKLKSQNPSLMLILNGSAIQHRHLYLPVEFCTHLCRDSEDIKVQDSDGTGWLFKLSPVQNRGIFIVGGWRKFITDKGLKVGDVCVFELIKSNNKAVLKASVFHAS